MKPLLHVSAAQASLVHDRRMASVQTRRLFIASAAAALALAVPFAASAKDDDNGGGNSGSGGGNSGGGNSGNGGGNSGGGSNSGSGNSGGGNSGGGNSGNGGGGPGNSGSGSSGGNSGSGNSGSGGSGSSGSGSSGSGSSGPGAGGSARPSDDDGENRGRGSSVRANVPAADQDAALEAVRHGFAVPFSLVIPVVRESTPGSILDAKLLRTNTGDYVYSVLVLQDGGRYRTVRVDAKRNRVIDVRQR